MKKMKVMTVVGTRPEIIRLSAVIKKLDESDSINHKLVHTGQNYDYELNEIFFKDFKIRKPDFYLGVGKGTAIQAIGNTLIRIESVLDDVKPDAFLILGDTNSCLCAIAAKRKRIPIFHMEAGNRCFDQRVPEEINRKIIDHISDINLTYSSIAREYLLQEGFPADRIIKTGSPMFEVIQSRIEDIEGSEIVENLGLRKGGYFVVSAHREENINSKENFYDLVDSMNTIADQFKMPLIVSTHPRTREMIREKNITFDPFISLLKPLGFNDYIKLQMNAKAVLSDSGTISEEASILGLNALNIRQAHERPEAMEEAAVMMVGLKKERILQGLNVLETRKNETIRKVADYCTPNVSDKVLRIILSYTDYVNTVVWKS